MLSDSGANGSVGVVDKVGKEKADGLLLFSVADDDGVTVVASRLRLGEGQEDMLVAARHGGMNTRTSVVSE
jgi:hypothetical protein